jgi:hypothetical protein
MTWRIDFGWPNLFWAATTNSAKTAASAHTSRILREIEIIFIDAPWIEFHLSEVLGLCSSRQQRRPNKPTSSKRAKAFHKAIYYAGKVCHRT